MVGDFELKLVRKYIEKNYPDYNWSFYVIKDDIMTITCRDNDNKLKEICVTLNDLIK
jgi:hypothetical protein